MKLSTEISPVRDLNSRRFLTCVGTSIGCPVLRNHRNEKSEIIVHLVNNVWNKGTDWTAHMKNKVTQSVEEYVICYTVCN